MKKYGVEAGYWVYILHCENDTYYTGYTNDLARRYQSHVDGSGKCKYTRSFKPFTIAQCWRVMGSKALAMQMERKIKTLSRQEKEEIIAKPSVLCDHPAIKTVSNKQRLVMALQS